MKSKRLDKNITNHRSFDVSSMPFRGTEDTIRYMKQLSKEGQVSPAIRKHAEDVIRKIQPKDYLSELASIYYDTCKTIRYTRDPAEAEYIQHPELVLKNKSADCDDIALYINALLRSISQSVGNQCDFTVVSFDHTDNWSHVFLTVVDERTGQRVVLDPVAGHKTSDMINQSKRYRHFKG
jgi:hypothetical protein